MAAINYDETLFASTIYSVFENPKFKAFKKEHVDLIVKYLTGIGRNEKNARVILNDVVNISKQMGQTESLIQYAMEIAQFERKQKSAMNITNNINVI